MKDPETDELPDWCQSYSIGDILIINPTQLRQRSGDGYMHISNQDYTVVMKQSIEEGDYIACRGEFHKVMAVSEDFNSEKRNCLRFKTNFKRNINRQKFGVCKLPPIQLYKNNNIYIG